MTRIVLLIFLGTFSVPHCIAEDKKAENKEASNVIKSFDGKAGEKATELFQIKEGLVIFKYEQKGKGHFSIWLVDANGKNVDLVTTGSGPKEGSKGVLIPSNGKYLLNINAAAEWKITIERPKEDQSEDKTKK